MDPTPSGAFHHNLLFSTVIPLIPYFYQCTCVKTTGLYKMLQKSVAVLDCPLLYLTHCTCTRPHLKRAVVIATTTWTHTTILMDKTNNVYGRHSAIFSTHCLGCIWLNFRSFIEKQLKIGSTNFSRLRLRRSLATTKCNYSVLATQPSRGFSRSAPTDPNSGLEANCSLAALPWISLRDLATHSPPAYSKHQCLQLTHGLLIPEVGSYPCKILPIIMTGRVECCATGDWVLVSVPDTAFSQ